MPFQVGIIVTLVVFVIGAGLLTAFAIRGIKNEDKQAGQQVISCQA
jgi:hypothetical protein